uniref:Uncharacterized protein n=1 Tax=Magallana gigas TaxID=29159 RepID=K1PT57_MAGGI
MTWFVCGGQNTNLEQTQEVGSCAQEELSPADRSHPPCAYCQYHRNGRNHRPGAMEEWASLADRSYTTCALWCNRENEKIRRQLGD